MTTMRKFGFSTGLLLVIIGAALFFTSHLAILSICLIIAGTMVMALVLMTSPKKRKLTTEEIISFVDAIKVANSSSDTKIRQHYERLGAEFKTLDKVPYEEAMKLIELTVNNKK